jgi:hypothetical protein
MTSNLEARLRRFQDRHAPAQRSHEDWLVLLNGVPPLTETESAALDAQIEAEAISESGSLKAAAVATRAKASRSQDPLDSILAADLKIRASA